MQWMALFPAGEPSSAHQLTNRVSRSLDRRKVAHRAVLVDAPEMYVRANTRVHECVIRACSALRLVAFAPMLESLKACARGGVIPVLFVWARV